MGPEMICGVIKYFFYFFNM